MFYSHRYYSSWSLCLWIALIIQFRVEYRIFTRISELDWKDLYNSTHWINSEVTRAEVNCRCYLRCRSITLRRRRNCLSRIQNSNFLFFRQCLEHVYRFKSGIYNSSSKFNCLERNRDLPRILRWSCWSNDTGFIEISKPYLVEYFILFSVYFRNFKFVVPRWLRKTIWFVTPKSFLLSFYLHSLKSAQKCDWSW